MSDTPLEALGRTAIPGDQPAGINARYEPDYEALTGEIGKLDNLNGASVDWHQVVSHGHTVLARQSKDLRIACYVCRGLFETDGYAGLARGSGLVADLVEHFWADMFPPARRLPARLAMLDWLVECVQTYLEQRPPTRADARHAKTASKALTRLEQALPDAVDDDKRAGLRHCAQVLAEAAAQDRSAAGSPTSSKTESASPAATSASAPPATLDFSNERARRKTLLEMAALIRRNDPADPLAYRILRSAIWGPTFHLPPSDDEGRTQAPPVADERLDQCQTLLGQGEYMAAIEAIEEGNVRAPLWLDGQRLAANALFAAGHAAAARAVTQATSELLEGFPGLKTLAFKNGTPLASSNTRAWLAEQQGALSDDTSPSGETTETGQVDTRPSPQVARPTQDKALDEALKQFDIEGFDTAIAPLTTHLDQAGADRERFLWRLARAQFMEYAGKARLAFAEYDNLDQIAIERDLAQWEPELAIKVARSLLECYKDNGRKSLAPRAEQVEHLKIALGRLAQLDPLAATEFMELKLG